MTKRIGAALFICFLVVFAAAIVFSGQVARAAKVNVEDVEYVVIDHSATGEDGKETELTSVGTDSYRATYGSVVVLHARPDDADTENSKNLYDGVYMTYQWYFAPKGSDEFSPLDEIVTTTDVRLTLTDCNQSGRYYIRLTQVMYDGDQRSFTGGAILSDVFTLEIVPKPLVVEYTVTEKVYNAAAQDVEYKIKGEVAGKPAGCQVEYDSSPTNAGTYSATVFTRNENYSLGANSTSFVITKAPLTIQAGDVVVLAGYSYEVPITYEGFCGADNENSLAAVPYIRASDLATDREPGFYEVYADGPEEDKNYELTYLPGTVQINRSRLDGDSVEGFSGKATGSFSSDAKLTIREEEVETVKSAFKFWQVPALAYSYRFEGTSNKDSYVVVMEDVTLPGIVRSLCFVNDEGKTETISVYDYDKDKHTLTMTMTQTSGHIVAYHNYLWYAVPAALVLLIVISLLIFHRRDRNKHKLNRLISGSAKVEADYYREKIGEYEERENRKV